MFRSGSGVGGCGRGEGLVYSFSMVRGANSHFNFTHTRIMLCVMFSFTQVFTEKKKRNCKASGNLSGVQHLKICIRSDFVKVFRTKFTMDSF